MLLLSDIDIADTQLIYTVRWKWHFANWSMSNLGCDKELIIAIILSQIIINCMYVLVPYKKDEGSSKS